MTMPAQKPGKSKQDYATPPEFIEAVCKRLGITTFTWDLAASAENKVAPFYYDETANSLVQDWDACGGWLWLNPPYSDIPSWAEKAASTKESYIAMLTPASVGANWFKEHVMGKAYVIFLNGRITFVGAKDPYPKDCMLLLYTPFNATGYEVWTWQNK